MTDVTFMYWYGSHELGAEKFDCTVAECSRCGLRVSAPGSADTSVKRCAELLKARCRLSEDNTYKTIYFESLAIP